MPSARRLRLVTLAAVVTVVFVLFYASGFGGGGQSADFYHKTMDAIGRSPAGQSVINSETGLKTGHIPADRDGDGDIDEDDHKQGKDLQEQMTKLAQEAKDNANKKAGPRPDAPSKLVGVGNSAEGNKKPAGEGKEAAAPAKPPAEAAADPAAQKSKEKERVAETAAEQALHEILKRAPVTIFSKSYCPYSKRAKGILLEKYLITPKPEVVELDEHPLQQELQDLLLGLTGRRTVPNILINGKSIGGADEVVALDNGGKLTEKIQELGQRKVEISARFSTEQVKGAEPAH